MNYKTTIPCRLFIEENYSSNPECKMTRENTYERKKRYKKLNKKIKGLNENEAKKVKWEAKLDSCLKQNIKIILRDQKHIQSLNKMDIGAYYENFNNDTSLHNSVKLKIMFEGMIKSFINEISSLEEKDLNGLNEEQRKIAIRLYNTDKDLEDYRIETINSKIKDKIDNIKNKIYVIEFEICIIDKIIQRLNDKIYTCKSYSNQEILDKTQIKIKNLINSDGYNDLVKLSKEADENILMKINSKSTILKDKNESDIKYMKLI